MCWSWVNPLCLGRRLDLRIPQGGPLSLEEAGAAGSGQPGSRKKARSTPLDLPRAANGPPGALESTPRAAIDLTAESSDTGAPPQTLSQEEGLVAPEEPEKAQDLHPRRGKRQESPVKARWVSSDDWEDLRDPVGYMARTVTLEAEQREQGEQTDPKGQEKPPEGEQPLGAPTPNPLRDGRATPDHWEDDLGEPAGDVHKGPEESAPYSNSEWGEETEFEF